MYKFLFFCFLVFISIKQASASSFIGTIPATSPGDMISTYDSKKVYVTDQINHRINVIDTGIDQIIKVIPLTQGSEPFFFDISLDGREIYLTERLGGKVSVIDTSSDTVVARIGTYGWPINEPSVSANGSKLYVADAAVRNSIRMSIIDIASRSLVGYFITTDAQEGMSFNPDGKTGYVKQTINNSNPLTVYTNIVNLETNTIIGRIPDTQIGIVSASGDIGWGHHFGTHTISKVDLNTNTIINTQNVTSRPNRLIMDDIAHPKYLFVSNDSSGNVTILDADTLDIIEVIKTSGIPIGVGLDKTNKKLYVSVVDKSLVEIHDVKDLYEVPNIAPVIESLEDQSIAEGELVSFDVEASDTDGDVVTVSAENIPSGAIFDAGTGTFSWTPSVSDAGEYTVTFLATDDGEPALSSRVEVHITVIDNPVKNIYDLLHELIEVVDGYAFSGEIEQSYSANLKTIEGLLNSAKYTPAENQIRAFIKKLEQDFKGEKITKSQNDDLYARANAVLDAIPDDAFGMVPLITQVVSPYPSLGDTTSWASTVYAGGRADKVGDCGRTIAQCGCAISSLSMVGKYHGVNTGFDGTAVNPLNMNNWLLENGGYSHDGSVLWNYALAYMGREKNGKVMSTLSLDGYNETNTKTVDSFVNKGNPSLGFSAAKGHYVVLTDVMPDAGYSINDPLWYNTKTTDDTRDVAGNVQDYNNVVSKANLIGYSPTLKPLSESIEILLESPAELLVIDEKGRRLGYDMATGNFWDEIPGGTYDREDFILNPETPESTPHKAKRIYIAKPEGESFEVKVIGTGEGVYHASFAITDGDGGLFGEQIASTTRVGNVDEFTVTTLAGTGALPSYLQNILDLVPSIEQKKFAQAFTVIAAQIEKDHVIPTENIIEGLVRFIENTYEGKTWTDAVIAALKAII